MAPDYGGTYGLFAWDHAISEWVSRDLDLKWSSQRLVSKDLSLNWDSGGMVGQELISYWDSGGMVGQELISYWDSGGQVGSNLWIAWESESWANQSLSLQWLESQWIAKNLSLLLSSAGYVSTDLGLYWNSEQFISKDLSIPWESRLWASRTFNLEWYSQNWVSKKLNLKWHSQQWAIRGLGLEWDVWSRIIKSLTLEWSLENFASQPLGSKWNSENWINQLISLRWNQLHPIPAYTEPDYGSTYGLFTWDKSLWTRISRHLGLKWFSQQWISKELSLNWLSIISRRLSLKWAIPHSYIRTELVLLWDSGGMVGRKLSIISASRQYVSNTLALQSSQSHPIVLATTKSENADWLEVMTPQGAVLTPIILSGHISWKYGSIHEAKMRLAESIPSDCRCTIFIAGDQHRFDGLSKTCDFQPDGSYLATIDSYLEIAKPNPPKGGLYLGKHLWENVSFTQLLNSAEPPANGNFVGIIYMMNSCIYYELWDIENEDKGVWKWDYLGLPYTISKVYSDDVVLTSYGSLDELEADDNSGYYYAGQTLYIRLADQTSPYYHIISVPNIWDGPVPIRLGEVTGTALSENILYWETANGDIPYEVIFNLMTCAGLEFAERYSDGVCYVDIMDTCGNGDKNSPAAQYIEKRNLIDIKELTLVDSRYQVTGVIVAGYGQGSTAILAGETYNMGRGGRFVRYEDPGLHSESMAEKFATNYLDEKRLPGHSITFDAPLVVGMISLDARNIGDSVLISAPSLGFENTLRIQELDVIIGDGTRQQIKAGDRLLTPEQIWQALKNMIEKYLKHRNDEMEPYDWSWTIDFMDQNLTQTNTFDVPDILAVQFLELTITIGRAHATVSQPNSTHGSSGGDGGGPDGGGGGCPNIPPGPDTTHGHDSGKLNITPSTDSVSCAPADHKHSLDSLLIGPPDGQDTAIQTIDIDTDLVVKDLSIEKDIAISALGTDCCTAAGCSKSFFNEITGEIPVVMNLTPEMEEVVKSLKTTTVCVATCSHSHSISGDIGPSDSSVDVSPAGHSHEIEAGISGSAGTPQCIKDGLIFWATNCYGDEVPILVNVGNYNYGSDPDMYLYVWIGKPADKSGNIAYTEVVGSPGIISSSEKTMGPIILNPDYVNEMGLHTLKLRLANKTSPKDPCHCSVTSTIRGRIFVDTIFGKGP